VVHEQAGRERVVPKGRLRIGVIEAEVGHKSIDRVFITKGKGRKCMVLGKSKYSVPILIA